MKKTILTILSLCVISLLSFPQPAQGQLSLQKGDHVTIIGNALPERMNHFGYFETLLHARHPYKNLAVRNIGYGGDVVNEEKNLRVEGYPGRDEWLSMLDTDVLLVMYGFNESFRGTDEVDHFRKQLSAFVKHVKNTAYNDQSPPRVVLFSPIAFEDLNDPNLPDGTEQNRNLKRYSKAIASVAKKHGVPFVDLFSTTRKQFETREQHLTFNGVHLTETGYKTLASILDRKLFGTSVDHSWKELQKLRRSVNNKNEYWFDRYRVNDKNDIYGTRSDLTFEPNNTSNREVLQHELKILDQMVKNRDRKVWATAQGKTYSVTDDNLPENMEVETDAPGDGPDGEYTFRGGKETIKKMDAHKNVSVNLFASEEQFPSLVNPGKIKFDTKGRLWVAAWEGYPTYKPPGPKRDKLIILKDTNGDGKADERTIFADHLKDPTGFHFWNEGVIVAQPPYIMYLEDRDGDGKADHRRRLLSNITAADTHSAMNNFVWGQGGKLFMSEGFILDSQIETPYGPVRNQDGAVWSFDPDTFRVTRYIPYRFSNAHGHDVNRWNQGFLNDATHGNTRHDTVFSGYLSYPQQHVNAPTLYDPRVNVTADLSVFSSSQFPNRFQGNVMVATVQGVRGVFQYNVKRDGSSYRGVEKNPILTSEDPNFRPVALAFGPKGALFVADWQNPLIDHMNHHIRDPSRDHEHGRIYRLTYDGKDASGPKNLDGKPIPQLLDLLKSGVKHTRRRAKIELDERDPEKVMKATEQWLSNLDPDQIGYEHHVLDGLWLHQWCHTVDEKLLKRVLSFEDPRARATAVRVLSWWHDDVDEAEQLLERAIRDPDPLVRLEAVRALSFFRTGNAARIALQVLHHDMDRSLKYTLNETIRALEPYWKNALTSGKPIIEDHTEGLQFLLDRVEDSDTVRQILLNQPSSPAVNRMILRQAQLPADRRRAALNKLARSHGKNPLDLLLDLIGTSSKSGSSTALVSLLDRMDEPKLKSRADELERVARETSSSNLRTSAFIALATIDGNAKRLASIASGSIDRAANALRAIKKIQDRDIRRSAYDFVKSVIFNPAGSNQKQSSPKEAFPPGSNRLRKQALKVLADLPAPPKTRFADLVQAMEHSSLVLTAARQARRISQELDRIPGGIALKAARRIHTHIEPLSPARRSDSEIRDLITFARELIEPVGSSDAANLKKQLNALKVRTVRIKTVPGKMRYNIEEFAVSPGETLVIELINSDEQPHNLVLTEPGAYELVGKASMQQLDGPAHEYVPTDEKVRNQILRHTTLLDPGESEKLVLNMPSTPGDYPYLCTFPGHWRTMNGVIHVRESKTN